MPHLDDISMFRDKPFSEAVDKLEKLMAQSLRAFLIGAGCSKCAGLPLTIELTNDVLENNILDKLSKELLTVVKNNFSGSSLSNIEDYLSELIDYLAILERRIDKNSNNKNILLGTFECNKNILTNAIDQIKQAIVDTIDKNISIETHWDFIKTIHRPIRPGKSGGNQCVDYLVLNYDTLIEDALALEKISFADGLSGGVTGWWDPKSFSKNDLFARVIKLHGSINWRQFPNESLPRRVSNSISGTNVPGQRIVIWPASTKYREIQLDPYAQLIKLAREILRPKDGSQRVLAICGYSFGDNHINLEIDRALYESRDLTVLVFWSDDILNDILQKWHNDISVREQVLIYGKRGFWHGTTIIPASVDLPWWKFESLTRLLGGER